MSQKILLLGAGEMQVPLILKAKESGLFTIVADYNPDAPGFKYADVGSFSSTTDENAILELAKKEKIDGIATSSDFPVRIVSSVCYKLGLKGVPQNAASICTNKHLQREIFQKNNLPSPKYFLLRDQQNAMNVPEDFLFPCIVKPVDSSASRGVRRIDDRKLLQEAIDFARQNSRSGMVLVEEYVTGPEFSVESLTQDGVTNVIAVTEKTTSGHADEFFVEERHVIPAGISKNDENGIKELVPKALKAVGVDNAASHVELKLTTRGPVLIEMACRLGGDYITSDLVPLATGVNMLENVLKIALNEKIDITKKSNMHSGIRFLTPENYKQACIKIDKIKKTPELVRSEIQPCPEGLQLKSSLDRLGYWICSTNNRDHLIELLSY